MSTASETSAVYDGHRLVVFTAVWIPVQFICVALRYLARYISSGSWGLDDILVLTSLFLQLCQAGVDIGMIARPLPLLYSIVLTDPQLLSGMRELATMSHISLRRTRKN